MTTDRSFRRIIDEGKCVGCGLCASIFPEALKMDVTASGYLRPTEVRELQDHEVSSIYGICPGLVHGGLPEIEARKAHQSDRVWGPYWRIALAHASDPQIRHEAATGGVLTALAADLLDSGSVDAVLPGRTGGLQPSFGQTQISRNRVDAVAGSGSVYGQAAPLEQLMPLLDAGERIAIVAKPCDISAVRRLSETDDRVDRLVTHFLTMVCGGLMPPFGMKAFLERQEITMDEVLSIRYRGFGCPGPTTVVLKDGRRIDRSYIDFWGEDASMWHLPWRCKICPDGTGEAADIAAADTWPGGSPTDEMMANDPGTNAVLARTEAGCRLLEDAVSAGYLALAGSATVDDLADWQPHQVRKKVACEARFDGMQQLGQLRIETPGLSTAELRTQMSAADDAGQISGTRERIAIGKHRDEFGY